MTQKPKRYTSRDEIAEIDIPSEKEEKLKTIFENTQYGEHIGNTVAAAFDVEGNLTDNAAVLTSSLHDDRMFDCVSSYMAANPDETRKASATVIDRQTDKRLRADIVDDQIWISPRSEDLSFQSFRDYSLYLESVFNITLIPTDSVNNK